MALVLAALIKPAQGLCTLCTGSLLLCLSDGAASPFWFPKYLPKDPDDDMTICHAIVIAICGSGYVCTFRPGTNRPCFMYPYILSLPPVQKWNMRSFWARHFWESTQVDKILVDSKCTLTYIQPLTTSNVISISRTCQVLRLVYLGLTNRISW